MRYMETKKKPSARTSGNSRAKRRSVGKTDGGRAPTNSEGRAPSTSRKKKETWKLRLYVAGQTPKSITAFENLKKICEDQLSGCYDLEVIDIGQQPELITREDIIATPTLVKELPKPIRKIIGDLSDRERILVALNLQPKNE